MLEGLRDAALLGVHALVLLSHAIEYHGQVFGVAPASRQPVGHQPRHQREQQAETGNEPRQALEERAAERPVGCDHQREHVVPERHHVRGLASVDRERLQAGDEQVLGAPGAAEVEHIVEVREG